MDNSPFTAILVPPSGFPEATMARFRRGQLHFQNRTVSEVPELQYLAFAPDVRAVLITVQHPLESQGCIYQAFTTVAGPESPPDVPRLQLLGPSGSGAPDALVPWTFIAWRRRVYHEQCLLYLEACWHPVWGDCLAIKGLEYDARTSSIKKISRAIPLLKRIEGVSLGRPYNTGYYRSSEEFHTAYRDKEAMFVNKGHPHPGDRDLRKALAISKSTFYNLVQTFGRPPPLT